MKWRCLHKCKGERAARVSRKTNEKRGKIWKRIAPCLKNVIEARERGKELAHAGPLDLGDGRAVGARKNDALEAAVVDAPAQVSIKLVQNPLQLGDQARGIMRGSVLQDRCGEQVANSDGRDVQGRIEGRDDSLHAARHGKRVVIGVCGYGAYGKHKLAKSVDVPPVGLRKRSEICPCSES